MPLAMWREFVEVEWTSSVKGSRRWGVLRSMHPISPFGRAQLNFKPAVGPQTLHFPSRNHHAPNRPEIEKTRAAPSE